MIGQIAEERDVKETQPHAVHQIDTEKIFPDIFYDAGKFALQGGFFLFSEREDGQGSHHDERTQVRKKPFRGHAEMQREKNVPADGYDQTHDADGANQGLLAFGYRML